MNYELSSKTNVSLSLRAGQSGISCEPSVGLVGRLCGITCPSVKQVIWSVKLIIQAW